MLLFGLCNVIFLIFLRLPSNITQQHGRRANKEEEVTAEQVEKNF